MHEIFLFNTLPLTENKISQEQPGNHMHDSIKCITRHSSIIVVYVILVMKSIRNGCSMK